MTSTSAWSVPCRRSPARPRTWLQDRSPPSTPTRPQARAGEHHRAEGLADQDARRPQGQADRASRRAAPRTAWCCNALKSVGLTPEGREARLPRPPAAGTPRSTPARSTPGRSGTRSPRSRCRQGARVIAKGVPPLDDGNLYYVGSDKSLDDPVTRGRRWPTCWSGSRKAYAWAHKNPDKHVEAIVEGDRRSDSRGEQVATAHAYQLHDRSVTPEQVKVEQTLADNFFDAGEITKKVDVDRGHRQHPARRLRRRDGR